MQQQTKKKKIYAHIPQRYHGVGEWSSCTEKWATLELLFLLNLCIVEADLQSTRNICQQNQFRIRKEEFLDISIPQRIQLIVIENIENRELD